MLHGLLLRILIASLYRRVSIFPDSEGYIDLARRLSAFDLAGYDGMRSPGFPLLIALCGNSLQATVLVQFALGVATSVLLFKNLLLLRFEVKNAVIITLFLGSFLHVFFYETAILTEALTLFFMQLACYILLNGYIEKSDLKTEALFSLVLGILVIIKPFYIFLPFLAYGFYLMKDFSMRKAISIKWVVFVFPLIAYLGWSHVNKTNTGYFVPSTLNGFYLSQNCVYFAEKTAPEFSQVSSIYVKYRTKAIAENDNVSMTIWRAYDELREQTGLSFPDLSNKLNEFSKDAISRNPFDYLKQVFYSWIDFWRPNICWNENDFGRPGAAGFFIGLWKIQAFLLKIFKIAFVLLLPLAFFRFAKTRKISNAFILTTVIVCASVLQAMATFGTNSRFSYPFEFLIVVLAIMQLREFVRGFPKTQPGQ